MTPVLDGVKDVGGAQRGTGFTLKACGHLREGGPGGLPGQEFQDVRLEYVKRTLKSLDLTAAGKRPCTLATRFCTSRAAILISVPTSKFTVMLICPLLVLLLCR